MIHFRTLISAASFGFELSLVEHLAHFIRRTFAFPKLQTMISIKRYLLVGLVFGILSLAVAITYRDIIEEEWKEFKGLHNKSYESNENRFRLKVFAEVSFEFPDFDLVS